MSHTWEDNSREVEPGQPIRFAGSTLGASRHVCAFFNNRDEEYRVLLPFIQEGFERGEKCFHIVDPALREEHLRRLESAQQIPATRYERSPAPRRDSVIDQSADTSACCSQDNRSAAA